MGAILAVAQASPPENLMTLVGAIAIGAALASIGGQWAAMRFGEPLLEICARWSCLLAISFGVAYLLYSMDESMVGRRPPWSIISFLLIGCLLFDTIRTWVKVRGFSHQDTPLFPRYTRNEDTDEWPADSTNIRLREWIQKNGYKQVEALHAYPFPELCIREFHFDSSDETIRFSVNFIPRGLDTIYVTYSASSISKEGDRYVTDNSLLPYGGCFPDKWKLVRRPLMRSPSRLLKRHEKRLVKSGKTFMPWLDLPLNDTKEQHRLLERTNEDRGILNPRPSWEQFGRFSQEGRYRMWKEILLLKYFGVSAS
ncbi:MAG: hypothetical protein CMI31_11800 [Opitutae bacterium]|nr:hypothetical protein [Opitutae bacterium]